MRTTSIEQARTRAGPLLVPNAWARACADHLLSPSPCGQIGEVFGPGLSSYFRLLKTLGLVSFFTAYTVYAINIIFTLTASADERDEPLHGVQQLARLSLAPMRSLYDPETDSNSNLYGLTTRAAGLDKRAALLTMSVLDLGAMIAFMAALAWFLKAVTRDVLQADLDTITAADFSVVLHGLPAEVVSEQEIRSHLETAPELKGTLARVQVGKAFGLFLDRLQAQGRAEDALESLDAEALATKKDLGKARDKLVAQIAKMEQEMGDLHESDLKAACAFLTFNTTQAKAAAQRAFPSGALSAMLLQPMARRFRGKHVLRMVQAREPSDILWQNLHHSTLSRHLRQGLAGFFVFALLLGTVGITISAKSYENEMPPAVACGAMEADNLLQCDALWNLTATTLSIDAARVTVNTLGDEQTSQSCDSFIGASSGLWMVPWTQWSNGRASNAAILPSADAQTVSCAARVCHGCYCQSKGFFAWYQNQQQLASFCSSYWDSYLSSWALKGMAILFVIISNAGFTAAIPILTRFEKLPSRGGEQVSTAIKMFLSTFFNAYVVTLLVYASITDLADFPLIFKGAYTDFSPAWYAAIGSSLFVTTFTQAVQPPLQSAVLGWVGRLTGRWAQKKQYTQRDMNALLAGPEWNLAVRVAQVLNASFLALVLCGSIPGAGFLLCFIFWLSYWADKYFLCKVARTPPRYDAHMVLRLRGLLVWGVWLHFGFTAWSFGQSNLPAYRLHLSDSEEALLARSNGSHGSSGQFNVGARLERWQCLVQGIPFLMLSLWLFVLQPYGGAMVATIKNCLPKKAVDESLDMAAQVTYQEAVASAKLVGLATYDIRDNPDYAPALRALKSEPVKAETQTAA